MSRSTPRSRDDREPDAIVADSRKAHAGLSPSESAPYVTGLSQGVRIYSGQPMPWESGGLFKIEDSRSPLSLGNIEHRGGVFTVFAFSEDIDQAPGFVEDNEDYIDTIEQYNDFCHKMDNQGLTKGQIDYIFNEIRKNNMYIVFVDYLKAELFKLLFEKYDLEATAAQSLAVEFAARASAVRRAQGAIKFKDRPDKSQKASEFLIEHYGARLEAGNLFQNEVRKTDPGLMKGLDNEFGGRRDELAKLIPTRRAEVNMRLGPDAEFMSVDERRKALTRMLHLGKK